MPWLMWPMAVIDALLTPRRWAPAPLQGLAARMSAALTRDSLPIARWLGRMLGWAARLRAALLRDRPGLQRVAWFVRQYVWAAVWSFIVVSRLWPRRTPVPDEDVPVRLLPAPDTYRDFQSPSLVVPSGNTAIRSPIINTLPMSVLIRAVSLRFARSMNNVPAFRLNQPSNGQPRISDLATKRAGHTAFRE